MSCDRDIFLQIKKKLTVNGILDLSRGSGIVKSFSLDISRGRVRRVGLRDKTITMKERVIWR